MRSSLSSCIVQSLYIVVLYFEARWVIHDKEKVDTHMEKERGRGEPAGCGRTDASALFLTCRDAHTIELVLDGLQALFVFLTVVGLCPNSEYSIKT